MAGAIFLNYRRGEDSGVAGRLFDRLEPVFTRDRLFMDVDSIDPGLDFVSILEEQVANSDAFLAIMGPGWFETTDELGQRRLDNPDDFVRIEIRSALAQGKRVIPVLIDNAAMPRADQLPEDIRSITRRNAIRVTHERFNADVQRLILTLRSALDEAEQKRADEKARAKGKEQGVGEAFAALRRGVTVNWKRLILVGAVAAAAGGGLWFSLSSPTSVSTPTRSVAKLVEPDKEAELDRPSTDPGARTVAATTLSGDARRLIDAARAAVPDPQTRSEPAQWRQTAPPEVLQNLDHVEEAITAGISSGLSADTFGRNDSADKTALQDVLLKQNQPLSPQKFAGTWLCRKTIAGKNGIFTYQYFKCMVRNDGSCLRLSKTTGSQRFDGCIYPIDSKFSAFIGKWHTDYDSGSDAGFLSQTEDGLRIIFPYDTGIEVIDLKRP